MKTIKLVILFSLGVAVGAYHADAQSPPANPLNGNTFRSVMKLPGGEQRDGSVAKIHWTVRFKENSFSWHHHDMISTGEYAFDGTTGAVTAKGGPEASFDTKCGVLTWGEHKYEPVKD